MKWKIILPLLIALPAVIIAFNEESDGKAEVILFFQFNFWGDAHSFSHC